MYLIIVRLRVLVVKILYVLRKKKRKEDYAQARGSEDAKMRPRDDCVDELLLSALRHSDVPTTELRNAARGLTKSDVKRSEEINSRGSYLFELRSESGRLRADFQLEPYHRQPRHRLHVGALSSVLTSSTASNTDDRSSVKLVGGSNREHAPLSVAYYIRVRTSDEEFTLFVERTQSRRSVATWFMEAVAARDSRLRSTASRVVL